MLWKSREEKKVQFLLTKSTIHFIAFVANIYQGLTHDWNYAKYFTSWNPHSCLKDGDNISKHNQLYKEILLVVPKFWYG